MAENVYRLTIDGPGKNALGTPVMQDVIRQVREAAGRPILVTGAGDAFSAGLNLKEVASLDVAGMERYLLLLDALIDALYDHPGPMVACVNGHAIAGGCVVALCADLRVAVDNSTVRIGLNEVALGLEFPPKILKLARHRVAPRSLERVTLEAGLYEPRRAVELGLIDEVSSDPRARAEELLATLASHPPQVYASTKRTLRAGNLDLTEQDRRAFRERVLTGWTSPEIRARVRAVFAR